VTAEATALPVGFVGVGQIGSGMAERLLGAGHPLTVHARRPEVRQRFAELGASVTSSLADVARGKAVVAVCVLTDDQVLDVALGDDGLIAAMDPGSTLVIHTTGSPRTAERLAETGAPGRVDVVDAPVSGTVTDARDGCITLLVGGDTGTVERCRPLLAAYGEPIIHLGALGMGQSVKLINNLLLAANVQLAAEALRLARSVDLPGSELAAALAHCSGATRALGMMAALNPEMPAFDGLRRFLVKDVRVASQVAAGMGVDLGFLGEVAKHGPAGFGDV
jgi:3-hydroxyisobutyrate dehydrogenase-like beta-hydroxyacid dehydrogenase